MNKQGAHLLSTYKGEARRKRRNIKQGLAPSGMCAMHRRVAACSFYTSSLVWCMRRGVSLKGFILQRGMHGSRV